MKTPALEVLARGLKQQCPSCGKSSIFRNYYELHEKCPACSLELQAREPNTWFFMYVSTAAITGIFFVMMFFFRTSNPALARAVLIFFAILTFFYTMPLRKSLGIALDYLSPG